MPKYNLTFSERRMARLRRQAKLLDRDLASVLRLGQDLLDEAIRAHHMGGHLARVDSKGVAETLLIIPGLAAAVEHDVSPELGGP